jgi:hypothetical protein
VELSLVFTHLSAGALESLNSATLFLFALPSYSPDPRTASHG